MWCNLASPPENFRYYKFTDNSAQESGPTRDINLEENKTTLFQPHRKEHKLRSVPEETQLTGCPEAVSIDTTQKGRSSLKTASKGIVRNHESAFDLNLKAKPVHHRQQSKSMLQSKQKSSVNLSQKNQSSWIIREQGSKYSGSSKNGRSFKRRTDNQEDEPFSQILINDTTSNRNSQADRIASLSLENSLLVNLIRQIRDDNKEQLSMVKRLFKLLEDRSMVSRLYEKEQSSEVKQNKGRLPSRKSTKRIQEKSTVKKMGKSLLVEQRLSKMEKDVKSLSKKIEVVLQHKKAATGSLSRVGKKSTSMLR